MGYCSPTWISDYTYKAILDRLTEVRATASGASALSLQPEARVLMVGGGRARWGLATTDTGEGAIEAATVRDQAGTVVASVEVRRVEVGEGDRWMILVPQPQPGWYSIDVSGAPPVRFDEPAAGAAFDR